MGYERVQEIENPEAFDRIGYTPFTKDIARQMIREFLPFRHKAEALLVHCASGACRSGSIGLAFNDIFKLGQKPEDISCVYLARFEDSGAREPLYPWFNNILSEASKEFPEI